MAPHRLCGLIRLTVISAFFPDAADSEPMLVRAGVIRSGITKHECDHGNRGPRRRMLASLLTFTGQEHRYARVAQHMRARSAFHWVSLMTDVRRYVEACILITVDASEQSLSRIGEALVPLGIPVSI